MKRILFFVGAIVCMFMLVMSYISFYLKQTNDDYYQCRFLVNEDAFRNTVDIAQSYCGTSSIGSLTAEEQAVCKTEASNSIEMTENKKMREDRLKKCEENFTWFYKLFVRFM